MTDEVIKPDVVDDGAGEAPDPKNHPISEPAKLIRIASMTRAMLDEVRQAPIDEKGRARLAEVHRQSIDELREVLSQDLQDEFDQVMLPLTGDTTTDAEIRIAQAQLIGWLEGLFHGIQASLVSQQVAAQHQLAEMQRRSLGPGGQPDSRPWDEGSGQYL